MVKHKKVQRKKMFNDFIILHKRENDTVLINTKLIVSAERYGSSTKLLLNKQVKEGTYWSDGCDRFSIIETPEKIYNMIYNVDKTQN